MNTIDYIFQKTPYEEQIKEAVAMIENADMYSAGFYPFPSEEARWGYWSKHAYMNRIAPSALPLYKKLFELVKDKDYFVLTTNVDAQFEKAGFETERIFATQGDYGRIQCACGCHQKIYDATTLFQNMNHARLDCIIPTDMVPKCPVCGGPMAMHLRCDQYFVEDNAWHDAANRYGEYLENTLGKNTVLIELGVGFNTPTIIRFPFEKMMREHDNLQMIRLNMDEAFVPESFGERVIGIGGDMSQVINGIYEKENLTIQTSSWREESQDKKLDYLVDVLKSERHS